MVGSRIGSSNGPAFGPYFCLSLPTGQDGIAMVMGVGLMG